jgi:hypothetical protein
MSNYTEPYLPMPGGMLDANTSAIDEVAGFVAGPSRAWPAPSRVWPVPYPSAGATHDDDNIQPRPAQLQAGATLPGLRQRPRGLREPRRRHPNRRHVVPLAGTGPRQGTTAKSLPRTTTPTNQRSEPP